MHADDPFKDPEEPASAISTRYVGLPIAGASTQTLDAVPPAIPAPELAPVPAIVTIPVPEPARSMPAPIVGPAPAVVNYPLPSLNEVTARDVNLGSVPSEYTLAARSSREASMNERDFDAEWVILFHP